MMAQFKSVLVIVLMAAGVVSIVVGNPGDGLVLMGIVVFCVLLGYIHDRRAMEGETDPIGPAESGEESLIHFPRWLGVSSFGFCAMVAILGLARLTIPYIFKSGLGVAWNAIPEALPGMVTLWLAFGLQRFTRSSNRNGS